MRKSSLIVLLVFVCIMALTACSSSGGGDGGDGVIDPASAPIADAGMNQNVLTGSEVTLDGSGSYAANGEPLTYSWSFASVPDGSGVDDSALSDPADVSPTFTPDVDGNYILNLVVNDGLEDSLPAVVTIIASSELDPEPGLAAYWDFEEGQGLIAGDSAGTHDGTLIGPPAWTAGAAGNFALFFNGETDYVSVPHADIFNADQFTLSFWLYNFNDDATRGIIRKSQSWHVRKDGNNELQFCLEPIGADTECLSSGYIIPDQEWHHYAIVVDNASAPLEVNLYVDDALVNTNLHASLFPSRTGELFIGQFSFGYMFHGLIDDVKFYDSAVAPVGP